MIGWGPRSQEHRQQSADGKRRSRRRRSVTENDEFAAFARRIVAAFGRRVASGDVEAIRLMIDLSEDLDTAIAIAVAGLRENGYSWSEIAARIGITKQTAHRKWGPS